MIKKTQNGKWSADIQPHGRGGKRFRKTFKTKAEAEQWVVWIKRSTIENSEWQPKAKDKRRLTELVGLWYDHHGHSLKDGANRRTILEQISKRMGNPFAIDMTGNSFTAYRSERLKQGITPSTINHEHAYLRAVFNELIRVDLWDRDNPLAKVRRLKVDEKELSYLTTEEIDTLLTELERSRC